MYAVYEHCELLSWKKSSLHGSEVIRGYHLISILPSVKLKTDFPQHLLFILWRLRMCPKFLSAPSGIYLKSVKSGGQPYSWGPLSTAVECRMIQAARLSFDMFVAAAAVPVCWVQKEGLEMRTEMSASEVRARSKWKKRDKMLPDTTHIHGHKSW